MCFPLEPAKIRPIAWISVVRRAFLMANKETSIIPINESLITGEILSFSPRAYLTIMDELRRATFLERNGVDLGVSEASIVSISRRFDVWYGDCVGDGQADSAEDIMVSLRPTELFTVGLLLERSLDIATAKISMGGMIGERYQARFANIEDALIEVEENDWYSGMLKRIRVFRELESF